jgi:geranylgeranyl diphosphate synthase type II
LTLDEIARHVPAGGRHNGGLYEAVMDYPLRPAKALRPALCIATAMAMRAHLDAVLPSAAALELFHNAFLVHDDVEDGSEKRRHAPTLHRLYGVPTAVNVGDGMLALALEPLLDNVRAVGLGSALRILRVFSRMARESAEGQMLELSWIRGERWDLADRDYVRMVHKKTGWYSFITPVLVGAIAAGVDPTRRDRMARCALLLGIAFQIQDDLLSIEGDEVVVGKDGLGDLWEGKYTLVLLHALREATAAERERALATLASRRPSSAGGGHADGPVKTAADVEWLAGLLRGRNGASLAHARAVALAHARRAQDLLARELVAVPPSVHRSFLTGLVEYVISRTH